MRARVILIMACAMGALFLGVRLRSRSVLTPAPPSSASEASKPLGDAGSEFLERRARSIRASNQTQRPVSLREQMRLGKFDEAAESLKPTHEQLERYLEANMRLPGSLLAAYNVSGDTNYLNEAIQRHPDDPRVQFAVLSRGLLPEQRREWLDAFNAALPDNKLPEYFSAMDYLKQGRTDLALTDLQQASKKGAFNDFYMESLQDLEEAYRSGGASLMDAKLLSMSQLHLPHLKQLRDLGRVLAEQMEQLQASGDIAGSQQLAAYGEKLGWDIAEQKPTPLITELVGMAIEYGMLKNMDAATAQAILGMSAQDRMAQLDANKASIRAISQAEGPWEPNSQMTDAEVLSYLERSKAFGERSAMQWWLQRNDPQR